MTTTGAPAALAALKLAAQSQPSTSVSEDTTLAELQRQLAKAKAAVTEMSGKLADAQAQPKQRIERRLEIAKAQTAAQKRLEEINTELSAAAPAGEAPEVNAARMSLLMAQKEDLRQETAAYQKELERYDAEVDLLVARRDAAAMALTRQQELLTALQEAVNLRRAKEAEQAAEKARRESAGAHLALRKLAD